MVSIVAESCPAKTIEGRLQLELRSCKSLSGVSDSSRAATQTSLTLRHHAFSLDVYASRQVNDSVISKEDMQAPSDIDLAHQENASEVRKKHGHDQFQKC